MNEAFKGEFSTMETLFIKGVSEKVNINDNVGDDTDKNTLNKIEDKKNNIKEKVEKIKEELVN